MGRFLSRFSVETAPSTTHGKYTSFGMNSIISISLFLAVINVSFSEAKPAATRTQELSMIVSKILPYLQSKIQSTSSEIGPKISALSSKPGISSEMVTDFEDPDSMDFHDSDKRQ